MAEDWPRSCNLDDESKWEKVPKEIEGLKDIYAIRNPNGPLITTASLGSLPLKDKIGTCQRYRNLLSGNDYCEAWTFFDDNEPRVLHRCFGSPENHTSCTYSIKTKDGWTTLQRSDEKLHSHCYPLGRYFDFNFQYDLIVFSVFNTVLNKTAISIFSVRNLE